MAQTNPQFGIDAPGVVLTLGLISMSLLVIAAVSAGIHQCDIASMTLGPGCSMGLASLLMVVTRTLAKPIVIRRMIGQLQLGGDEQVLDVGCGLLLEAARQLPRGRATGLDLWSTRDQSGNAANVTARNAELAGVTDRVQIDTGDMRQMPYAEAGFDVIISSLAIHNLPSKAGRDQALCEIARVLKPGGRLAVLDFRSTADYIRTLRRHHLGDAWRPWPNLLMFPWVWIVRGRKA